MTLATSESVAFLSWMLDGVVAEARGDRMQTLSVRPDGRLWLGRLAPLIKVQNSRLGERSERLEPCEVGVRLRPTALDGREIACRARLHVWGEFDGGDEPDADRWRKSEAIEVAATLVAPTEIGHVEVGGREEFAAALTDVGATGLECEFHAEVESGKNGPELIITVVNVSPEEIPGWDTNLYEVTIEVDVGSTDRFVLDNLPDSFRYDRTVAAYGVNGGVEQISPTVFRTTDVATHDQYRPKYWDDGAGPMPDLSFGALAADPLPPLRDLIAAMERWGGSELVSGGA